MQVSTNIVDLPPMTLNGLESRKLYSVTAKQLSYSLGAIFAALFVLGSWEIWWLIWARRLAVVA